MELKQNIVSLTTMLLLLPLILIIGLAKFIAAGIVAFAQLLLNKRYDKSKEWKIIKMFNKLGELVLKFE